MIWDETTRRVDRAATDAARKDELSARKKRGKPFDAFNAEWSKKKPPEEILEYYGTWPDAKPNKVWMRA